MLALKPFTIYRSSAGSGKTRTLAKVYLTWALRNRAHYFRHILAVTFTNKATQEMKDRVLAYLAAFSGANTSPWPDAEELASELKKELKLDDATFTQNSSELLTQILHQYDQFSISTIDAFFQRVIRAFTRESGLLGDYRLEVDQEAVLNDVVDNLIDELAENKDLTRWVVNFALDSLESDKSWDIRKRLVDFSNEIFRDEFKLVEEDVIRQTGKPGYLLALQAQLEKTRDDFKKKVSKPANEIWPIIREKGWTWDHIKGGKGSGLKGYLETFTFQKGEFYKLEVGSRMMNDFVNASYWPGKNYPLLVKEIQSLAEKELVPRVLFINKTYESEFRLALKADIALKNLYAFGLIADMSRKLAEYKADNNIMLLADAPKLLNTIIGDSDTPFIYEKVGSFYRNYLIDEFQDTSSFQWKNFKPLVANSLDQGYPSMIVGDVKQAIYRWRGGDLNLLEHKVEADIGKFRIDPKELNQNFRSAKEIVDFNNRVFASISQELSKSLGSQVFTNSYRDVNQETTAKGTGLVRVRFIDNDHEEKWMVAAREMVAKDLEYLQGLGVAPGEIAILVRRNKEGQEIAASLLEYKHSDKRKKNIVYDVVSNESLRIDGASTVNLLLAALRHLSNTDDHIARAQLYFEYARLYHPKRAHVDIFDQSSKVFFESQVPKEFTDNKLSLKKLPLFELTETLIGLFGLGKVTGELAYLQAFQDLVLDFFARERNDLEAFLEWWEENKDSDKTSIILPGDVAAARIVSIHKAKGLQFKYVLVPFCSWYMDYEGFKQPHLWVKSDGEPYASAGAMPVKYSKAMLQTDLAGYYTDEQVKVYLDNLNILYVALTRAERGMIITAPGQKVQNFKQVVSSRLHMALSSPEFAGAWSEATQELTIGSVGAHKEAGTATTPTLPLDGYVTSRWRDKLVIRKSGNIFFDGMNPETRKRISYGVYLHAVLSRIHTTEEVTPVLDRLVREGAMQEVERIALEPELAELLANPVVSKWFSGEWDVRTEVPILLPGGASNRIDRLLVKDKHAVVVDFKTGEQSKTDHKQVLEYLDILKQMGFTDVEGYLLYTRDKEVVAVGAGRPKVVKKNKDDNQLNLEL